MKQKFPFGILSLSTYGRKPTFIQDYRNIPRIAQEHRTRLLESAYESALEYDLKSAGLLVEKQAPMPFIYKGVKLDAGYRIDLLVENKVIVEIKAVESLAPVHFAQVLTYLKLSQMKLGLLINFNCKLLKDGIHRLANNMY